MKKKLYLSKEDCKFLGVCSGLSNYLNLDVSILRISTVILTLLFPVTIIIYFAIWFILPENNSNSRI
ncbi:MAG: PspC domain-containing protein [Clostridiales bacterium]